MLILYSDKTTSFSTLGIGVLRDFKSDPLITEELNGAYTLEFSYAKNGYLVDHIVEGAIVKANNQPFRIWTIKKDMDAIEILAKHIFFDLSTNFLEDVAPTNLKSQEALEWILEKAQVESNFNVSGDCSIVASARYVRKNITDAIYNEDNAILKRFGGEIELNGYNVTVHAKRGKNANFSIRYRKNLTGIEFNLDFSTVATRIMPQGANELLLDEKYVDSPLINNYFTPIYKKIDFSNVAVDENTTLEEAQDLLREEVNKLFAAGLDKPEISIKVDFVELSKCIEYKDYSNLESCGLGDTVKAIISELNLDLETRIVKTVYNCTLERYTTLELGNIKTDFVSSQSKVINEINNVVSNVNPESILSKAKEEATEIINHPFNGNIYIDKNTGVLYLMDTNDISTAKNIWKWSLGGLGFSENGVNGPYETAITQDGSIVADFITSGKINTSLIEGYEQLLLQVENNEEDIAQLTIDTDDITSRVSSAETSLNTLNDTITNIRSTILEQTNEAFTMWFEETGLQGDLDDVQELLQSQNITLEEIKAYIRFGTINDTTSPYYGSPYIELGKEDANTKLRVLDNRIQFLTGENETAYISNNTLYINESTVLTRQTMGTESTGFWITEIDSEGNQNTRWGGN